MPQPFEAELSGLDAKLDGYVEQVFTDLQSDILILPKGESMAELDQFKSSYAVLKRHTNDLAKVTVGNLISAIEEDSVVFILVRVMLGLTPTEWAKLAEEETGVEIPQGYSRGLDTKAISRPPDFLRASDKRSERVGALLRYAVNILNEGIGEVPDDVSHRLDMVDKGPDAEPLSTLAREGVPYERLLFERYRGRPFATYRDAVSEKVGNRMEDAVESELEDAGVPHYRTEATEEIEGINQAPDFIIPSKDNPQVVIEAKITGDDGTARDKVTRVQRLKTLSRDWGDTDEDSFQVVACIDGRGFGVRKRDMKKLLKATDGKVFTTKTLDQLVENTRISGFLQKI